MKIYAISDQHGELPSIPPCDLLIVGGDNCLDYPPGAKARVGTGPQTERQRKWFDDVWVPWANSVPAKYVVATWGNHDYCGEILNRQGNYRFEKGVMVVDDVVEIEGVKIWLTPWSSQYRDWAFMAEDWRLLDHYKDIPPDIDILVSHQPPSGYGDVMFDNLETGKRERLGSKALKETVMRVKPKAVVCGHIHSGYGESVIEHFATREAPTFGGEMPVAVTRVYNVAILNERYEHVNPPTEIVL